jgi:hypothetical protein
MRPDAAGALGDRGVRPHVGCSCPRTDGSRPEATLRGSAPRRTPSDANSWPKRPCAIVSPWGGFVDLARTFCTGKVVASCDDEGERARRRLRVYLKRTAPRVLRRTSFDFDCDPQTFQTRYRSDIVVVFHAIARIAEDVRRR